jgi:hypothetical protein
MMGEGRGGERGEEGVHNDNRVDIEAGGEAMVMTSTCHVDHSRREGQARRRPVRETQVSSEDVCRL